MGQEPKQKEAGRLSQLRKYIPTAQDAEIVKGMIADGLSNEDILHALGYVSGAPNMGNTLPNGHEHSNKLTTEQEEKEAQAAEMQPGQVEGEDEGDGEEAGGDDMLTHVAGLLSHVAKGKAKNTPKGRPASANRR